MSLRLHTLCLDANNPSVLAHFWAEALRWTVCSETGDAIGLLPMDGTRLRVLFEPVPDEKKGRNRNHLDLTTSSTEDLDQTVQRLIGLGARRVDIGQGADAALTVLVDPEGNEFCVIEPTNRFLADCGRLGAINCDGSREAGCFWSAALGWPLVWDENDETAIRAPDGTGPFITWSGPPLMAKYGKNRLHLGIAPEAHGDQRTEVDRLVSLGATEIQLGRDSTSWVVMADPDGNEFCVLTPR